MYCKRVKVRAHEIGLLFKDNEFVQILNKGNHWCLDPMGKTRVDVISMRSPFLHHQDLDLVIASGHLDSDTEVVELLDNERGLVWVDNRFATIIGPGQHVLLKGFMDVQVERINTTDTAFNHPKIRTILESVNMTEHLVTYSIEENMVGVLFIDGDQKENLQPGTHAFWRKSGKVKVLMVDIRETAMDVSGQEILTRDKVTLRINALVTYKVVRPKKAVTEVEQFQQTLYREAQLALRGVVGTKNIDELLVDKDTLSIKIREILSPRVASFGLEIIGCGIKDIILPGDMKELLNKVVESKKAAEANLITRREETAAMRNQANTAKLLANNPTLMRLKELELLEKVVGNSNLNIVCGDGPLSDSVMKLI